MEEIIKIKKTLERGNEKDRYSRVSSEQGKNKTKNPVTNKTGSKQVGNQGPEIKTRWSEIVRRGRNDNNPKVLGTKQSALQGKKAGQPIKKVGTTTKQRKLPKTAAVVISCPPGLYEETMREAKEKIQLKDCGIKGGLNFKRALTSALTLEFPGPEGNVSADNLANKLRNLFANKEGIKISRPVKMAEMRIRDLDDSIRPDELKYVVTEAGGCHEGEVRVGPIRKNIDGLGIAWIKCPLSATNKIMERGRLQIGWANARVQMLEARPLQCFRCLESGHVKDQCRSKIDRSDRCYRCGEKRHKAQTCLAPPRCPVCTDLGCPANHRAGNKACVSAQTKGRIRPTGDITVGQIISENRNPSNRETSTNEVERCESPKPQRKKRPILRNTDCEEMAVDNTPKTQEERDRELRAAKIAKTHQKARKSGKRRSDDEQRKSDTACEPEDSRHDFTSK